MEKKKLAVIFPGMGYHRDKPLLYYSAKLVRNLGFEVLSVEYRDMPRKAFDADTFRKARKIAFSCAEKQLNDIDFAQYEDIVFIGKSIGTTILAKYARKHEVPVRQIWYTPIEESFAYDPENAVAFIGEADPASDLGVVRKLAGDLGVKLYTYPDCNHSLECADVDRNICNLRDVMQRTSAFLAALSED